MTFSSVNSVKQAYPLCSNPIQAIFTVCLNTVRGTERGAVSSFSGRAACTGVGIEERNAFVLKLSAACTVLMAAVLALAASTAMAAVQDQKDPLDSPSWDRMHRYFLEQRPYVFDDRVRVIAPSNAEDAMNVPVKIDATAIDDVQRMVVFADLNPISQIMELEPVDSLPVVSFNFKVQQGTPLRAAVLDREGVWHVGGVYLEAAGGGCTQPSVGSGNADWAAQLGKVTARLWPTDDGQRMRVRILHPMDTGLAPRIPVFIIEKLEITDRWGQRLALLSLHEPIAENPILTLDLKQRDEVQLFAIDNNGNRFAASVASNP